MKTDGLFVIVVIFFIFAAWVATGGPTRPISQSGPFLTPVQRPGEESQGYRYLVPTNPIDTNSYPKQIGGGSGAPSETISSGPDRYTRSSTGSNISLEHSIIGPSASDPDQEYITLDNNGTKDVTIGSWTITSAQTGSRTVIQPDLILPAGRTLTLIVGRPVQRAAYQDICNDQSASCTFLSRTYPLFGHDTDTITLRDSKGTIVDTFSY